MSGMDTRDGYGSRGRSRSRGGSGWGGRSGYQNNSYGGFQGNTYNRNFRGGSSSRGRSSSSRGRGFGGRSRSSHRGSQVDLPSDVKELTKLGSREGGHDKTITALAFDYERMSLYSGGKDNFVCVWDINTCECKSKVPMDGEVDSLLIEGGFLFVGVHNNKREGIIKTFNMTTGAAADLTGFQGEVYVMHVANNMLFSGGNDKALYVWTFDPASNGFVPQARIGPEQGGHSAQIKCMTSLGTFLYTGDFTGCIKVWDLAGGACTQTITDAHTHVVSQMMNWEENGVQYIISSSYDGTIRVWAHEEAMAPGAVLKPTPIFTYPDSQLEDPSSFRSHRLCMILDMMGQLDGAGQPVLVTSHGDEQLARMFGLPAFDERGVLPRITDARAICAGPNGLMFCGLHNGLIRVFQLQPAA